MAEVIHKTELTKLVAARKYVAFKAGSSLEQKVRDARD